MKKIISTAALMLFGVMTFAQNRLQVDVSAMTTNIDGFSTDGFGGGDVTKTIVDSDGKIYCIGSFSSYNGVVANNIVRLLSTGEIDNTFQTGAGFGTINNNLKDILIQKDGKIVIVGGMWSFNSMSTKRGVVRLLNDGSLDNTFDVISGGINIATNVSVNTIDTLSNGDYVIGGNFSTFDGAARPAIAILNRSNGTLNTTANATFAGALASNANILDLTVNGNDEITVVGSFELNIYGATMKNIARFKNGLVPDATFASNGAGAYYTFNGEAETILELANGDLLVGGLFKTFTETGATSYPNFICLNSNGTHNSTFTYPTMSALPILSGMNLIKQAADGTLYFVLRNRAAGATTDLNRIIKLTSGVYSVSTDVVTEGLISDLTPISNNNVLLSGAFQKFGASSYANRIAKIDNNFTSVDFSFNNHKGIGVGNVNTVFTLSDGSTLIGGSFKGYDNGYKPSLVRVKPDGTIDPNFVAPFSEEVFSIAEIGSGATRTIAVGAGTKLYFLDDNGLIKAGFINISFNSGSVLAMAVHGGKLYIGGNFHNMNGNSNVSGFTRLETSNGALDANYNNTSNSNRPIFYGSVRVIKSINNVIYVGGDFTHFIYGSSSATRETRSICRLNNDGSVDTGFINHTTSGILNGTNKGVVNDIIGIGNPVGTTYNHIMIVGKFTSYQHSAAANNNFPANNIVVISGSGQGLIDIAQTDKFKNRTASSDEVYSVRRLGAGADARLIFGLKSNNGYASNAKYKRMAIAEETTGNPDTYYSNLYTEVVKSGNITKMSEVSNGSFFVAGSELLNVFEADRKRAIKMLFAPAAPVLTSPQEFCSSSNPQILNLNTNGYANLRFYDAPSGGNLLGYSTGLTDGTTYYVADVVSGSESIIRTPVTVNLVNEFTRRDTVTACGSYTWTNGSTYTTSTNASYVYFVNSNPAGCDSVAYLVLTINNNATSTVRDTACETYTWALNGATYTASTSVSHTLQGAAANGCDSIVTLELVITNNTTATVNVTECESYTWAINGQTYTSSTTATATIPNYVGCDSLITLNLVINNIDVTPVVVNACSSYTWSVNGSTYTTTQKDTVFLSNTNGCDSLVILDLTINQPSAPSTINVTHCGTSYAWEGSVYTTDGQYTKTLTNVTSCDSVVTLNLTLLANPTRTETIEACDAFTWSYNNVLYNTVGTHIDTVQFASGATCDSLVILNLTIVGSPVRTETIEACDAFTWSYNNVTYNTAGIHTAIATVASVGSCDSIITLSLTIVSTPSNEVALTNGTLTATASGATYQWFDCATNAAISGATSQSFTPSDLNKEYSVEVSNGDCAVMSNCILVEGVGIKEYSMNVSVFPNPTQNVVNVTLANAASLATITVMDIAGKVLNIQPNVMNSAVVDLSNFADGVYLIKVRTNEDSHITRIVKH